MKPHKNNSEIAQLLKYQPHLSAREQWRAANRADEDELNLMRQTEIAIHAVYGDVRKTQLSVTWIGLYAAKKYPTPYFPTIQE